MAGVGGGDVHRVDAGPVESSLITTGGVLRPVLPGKFTRALLRAGANGYEFGLVDALKVNGEAVGDLAEAEDGPVEGCDGGGIWRKVGIRSPIGEVDAPIAIGAG